MAATFDGATPDGNNVVFSSLDSLVPAATGLEANVYSSTDYLYDRDISAGQTYLVDVNDNDELLNENGAVLGNGNFLTFGPPPSTTFLPADVYGTTTHAISNDGREIFFESPAPGNGEQKLGQSLLPVHLYMRKDNSVTVALDNPTAESKEEARYLGASEDGSKVFFISNEGLAGDSYKDTELYMYDTETEELTAISVAPEGEPKVEGGVDGVTAIANDGSRVYYVAKGVLATNTNSMGQTAVTGKPNFYVYDTNTGKNTFITQFGETEVEPAPDLVGRIVSYLDLERPAVPTPDGNVLVFSSNENLTGEDANSTTEVYRYDAPTEQLLCISCDPGATGSASLAIGEQGEGSIGGGSYDPPHMSAPMNATGEEIFFDTENTLLPEDQNGNAEPSIVSSDGLTQVYPKNVDVYEWDKGQLYLVSSGKPGFTSLQGVTPSGNDAFIDSDVNLTKQNTQGFSAIYDVRVNGGFSEPESTPTSPCDDNESCRSLSAPNPTFSLPASSVLQAEEVAPAPLVTSPSPAHKTSGPSKPKKKTKKKKKEKGTKKTKAPHKTTSKSKHKKSASSSSASSHARSDR